MSSVLALIVLAFIAALAMKAALRPKSRSDTIRQRSPLTEREQAMYHRLRAALPEHVILAQVSLGALLMTRSHATRNRFSQKIADFVVCTRAFEVLAVIELDDTTHKTKRARDAERDAMITGAGLRTIRYANIPDAETITHDISRAEPRAPNAPARPAPAARPGTRDGTARTGAQQAKHGTLRQTAQRSNPAL